MKIELYLNLRTSWYEIWETIRVWLEASPHSHLGEAHVLPNRLASGSGTWSTDGESVKAIQLDKTLKVTYVKICQGVTWRTELLFARASRSIYTCITVEPSGNDKPVEIKPPRIVARLKKRFGQMNPTPSKRPRPPLNRAALPRDTEPSEGKCPVANSGVRSQKPRAAAIAPSQKRQLNAQKLAEALRKAAFDMLTLPPKDCMTLFKQYATGKYWAEKTNLRKNTIGSLIDLKGNMRKRGETPNDVAQLYYMICTRSDVFALFEAIEKSKRSPRVRMPLNEHCRQLKNEMEQRLNNNR